MTGVTVILLVIQVMNILPDKFLKQFLAAKFSGAVCFNYFLSIAIF